MSSKAVWRDSLYGVINAVMLVPVMISFCSIIFRNVAFSSSLPQLIKLVLFSSAVHQLAFTVFSSLPFAIGQVQDAGLIFLSAMAGDIVEKLTSADPNSPELSHRILATTLVTLSLSTFLLGLLLIVLGRMKLASIVQYLPMPVIGGYLAFIGFFCGEAGLAMMAGVDVGNLVDWDKFYSTEKAVLMAPGIVFGVAMYLLLRAIRSPFALPFCMLAVLVIFYSTLFIFGVSFESARTNGWIAPLGPQASFVQAFTLFDLSAVQWFAVPSQCLRFLGMFFVVAFSSSLDVAAIEMELGLPLDYNR